MTEFLPGEEYEVNCLSDLQGSLLYANIRRFGRRMGGHVLELLTARIKNDLPAYPR